MPAASAPSGSGPAGPPPTPWPPGSATGVGSLPGTDPLESARLVFGELADLPHLPELPSRGPGADLLGRAAALLVDLYVDRQPSGWRLVDRPGLDHRRAADYLEQDLDALQATAGDHAGPVKVAVAGPWTLAAGVELARGDRVLADAGARRDLVASLTEGVVAHIADLRRRLPRAVLVLQLDEPALPAVLAGAVPTASGFRTLRSVPDHEARAALRQVVDAVQLPVLVHCCAPDAPVRLLREAGVRGVSLDLALVSGAGEEAIGAAVEAGGWLLLGVVPGVDASLPDPAVTVEPLLGLWHRLGFAPDRLAAAIVPTPTCGLAGASPAYARAAMARVVAVGRRLVEDPEG